MSPLEPAFFQVSLPHERALVRVLLMAQRRRLNTAVMVDRLAHEFSRWRGRSLRQLGRLIADGVPLIDALEQSPRVLDPAAVMALRLAIETGTFPERLESLIAGDVTQDSAMNARRNATEGQLYQVIIGVMATWFVITFMMVFIVPTIEKMFQEFDIVLPAPMKWFIAIGNYFGDGWFFLIWSLVMLSALGLLVFGRPLREIGFRRRLADPIAALLAILALVAPSGRPLISGIGTLSRVHPSGRIRRRLVRAAAAIEGGENGWQALADQNFLNHRESRSLQMTDEPLAQAWLLRRAAWKRRFATEARSGLLFRGISLASLFLLAAFVALAAVAMFMSVYGLVDGLSEVGNAR